MRVKQHLSPLNAVRSRFRTQKHGPERKDSTSHYITHTHHEPFEDVVQKPYELFTTIWCAVSFDAKQLKADLSLCNKKMSLNNPPWMMWNVALCSESDCITTFKRDIWWKIKLFLHLPNQKTWKKGQPGNFAKPFSASTWTSRLICMFRPSLPPFCFRERQRWTSSNPTANVGAKHAVLSV